MKNNPRFFLYTVSNKILRCGKAGYEANTMHSLKTDFKGDSSVMSHSHCIQLDVKFLELPRMVVFSCLRVQRKVQ